VPTLLADKLRACRVPGARSQLLEQIDRLATITETGTRNGALSLELPETLEPVQLTCFDSNFANPDLALGAGGNRAAALFSPTFLAFFVNFCRLVERRGADIILTGLRFARFGSTREMRLI